MLKDEDFAVIQEVGKICGKKVPDREWSFGRRE